MNTIGPYELLGKVAQSTSSTVWKAHDPHLDRDVALKQVDRTGNPAALHQEATVLAALDHPNIVRVIDIISIDDTTWLVEEWVDGATLAAVRDHSGRLSTAQAVGTVRGALQGLAYAHHRGIVHGDIAPGNILVDLTGVSKLVDFGAGHGTTGYQSPEVAGGQPAGKPSDVYSAAAVLADLLSENQPAARHTATDTQPATTSGPIGQVLDKALRADPNTRHPDALALLTDLDDAAERTLGPGWLSLAGVSGLASATLSGTAVALAEAGGATSTLVAGTAATGTTPAAALPAVIAAAPIKPLIPLPAPDAAPAVQAGFDQPSTASAADKAAEAPQDVNIDAHPEPEFTQAAYTQPIDPPPMQPAPTPKPKPTKWIAIGAGAAATVAIIIVAVLLTRPSTDDPPTAAVSRHQYLVIGSRQHQHQRNALTLTQPLTHTQPKPRHQQPQPHHHPLAQRHICRACRHQEPVRKFQLRSLGTAPFGDVDRCPPRAPTLPCDATITVHQRPDADLFNNSVGPYLAVGPEMPDCVDCGHRRLPSGQKLVDQFTYEFDPSCHGRHGCRTHRRISSATG